MSISCERFASHARDYLFGDFERLSSASAWEHPTPKLYAIKLLLEKILVLSFLSSILFGSVALLSTGLALFYPSLLSTSLFLTASIASSILMNESFQTYQACNLVKARFSSALNHLVCHSRNQGFSPEEFFTNGSASFPAQRDATELAREFALLASREGLSGGIEQLRGRTLILRHIVESAGGGNDDT